MSEYANSSVVRTMIAATPRDVILPKWQRQRDGFPSSPLLLIEWIHNFFLIIERAANAESIVLVHGFTYDTMIEG